MNNRMTSRIEIPVHFDLWMRGARTGYIHSIREHDGAWLVRMDHPQVRKLVVIPKEDQPYCKAI